MDTTNTEIAKETVYLSENWCVTDKIIDFTKRDE